MIIRNRGFIIRYIMYIVRQDNKRDYICIYLCKIGKHNKKHNIFYDQFRNVPVSGVAVTLSFNVQINLLCKCIYIRLGNMEEESKMGEIYIDKGFAVIFSTDKLYYSTFKIMAIDYIDEATGQTNMSDIPECIMFMLLDCTS